MEEHLLLCYSDNLVIFEIRQESTLTSIEFNSSIKSFQLSLSAAVGKRNLNAFRDALHTASDAEKPNKETKMSIFDEVCQTPGCHEFITECIHAGCDVNKVNLRCDELSAVSLIRFHCSSTLSTKNDR